MASECRVEFGVAVNRNAVANDDLCTLLLQIDRLMLNFFRMAVGSWLYVQFKPVFDLLPINNLHVQGNVYYRDVKGKWSDMCEDERPYPKKTHETLYYVVKFVSFQYHKFVKILIFLQILGSAVQAHLLHLQDMASATITWHTHAQISIH